MGWWVVCSFVAVAIYKKLVAGGGGSRTPTAADDEAARKARLRRFDAKEE